MKRKYHKIFIFEVWYISLLSWKNWKITLTSQTEKCQKVLSFGTFAFLHRFWHFELFGHFWGRPRGRGRTRRLLAIAGLFQRTRQYALALSKLALRMDFGPKNLKQKNGGHFENNEHFSYRLSEMAGLPFLRFLLSIFHVFCLGHFCFCVFLPFVYVYFRYRPIHKTLRNENSQNLPNKSQTQLLFGKIWKFGNAGALECWRLSPLVLQTLSDHRLPVRRLALKGAKRCHFWIAEELHPQSPSVHRKYRFLYILLRFSRWMLGCMNMSFLGSKSIN